MKYQDAEMEPSKPEICTVSQKKSSYAHVCCRFEYHDGHHVCHCGHPWLVRGTYSEDDLHGDQIAAAERSYEKYIGDGT